MKAYIEDLYTPQIDMWVKRLAITAGSALLVLMTAASMVSAPPAKQTSAEVLVVRVGDQRHIVETRTFEGVREETVTFARVMYSANDPARRFTVEGGSFDSVASEFTTVYTMMLPDWATGRWCISTRMSWWPAWSQVEFSTMLPDTCFLRTNHE